MSFEYTRQRLAMIIYVLLDFVIQARQTRVSSLKFFLDLKLAHCLQLYHA